MRRVVRRTDRALTRVFGRDPLKMLQGLATNDVASLSDGQSIYTTFLTPKGKLVGDARILRQGAELWIEADRAASDNIRAHLKKSVPPLFARFEPLDSYSVVTLSGEDAQQVAAQLGATAVLLNPFRADVADLITDDVHSTVRRAQESGALEGSEDVLEIERVERGEPKWGAELTEEVIPLEAGLRNVAISENKGCYTGQEVIIRILHRGHVNRQLRRFTMTGDSAPPSGAQLTREVNGKALGHVTSAVYSPQQKQVVGLAYVRREVEAPADLLVDGKPARISGAAK